MAVAFRSIGTFASGTSACSPGLPTGWAQNDIFLLLVESDDEVTPNTPSGWEPGPTGTQGSGATGVRLTTFLRRATASESAPTVDGTTDHIHAVIAAISGANSAGSVTASDVVTLGAFGGQDTQSGSVPAITATVADSLIAICMVSTFNGNSSALWSSFSNANLTGITERQDQAETTGRGGGTGLYTATKATTGDTGATTTTHTTAVSNGGVHIAFYAAQSDHPLDAQPGSFTIADAASLARVVAQRVVNAVTGSFVLSGVAATQVAARVLNGVPGSYTLNGTAAGLITARVLNATPGVFTITGIDATLVTGGGDNPLNAEPGVFTLTGLAAGAVAQRVVSALPGSYVFTGAAAGTLATRTIGAVPGSFTVTGVDAGLVFSGAGAPTIRNRTLLGVGL